MLNHGRTSTGTAMDTGAYRDDRQEEAAQEPWLAFRHAAVRDLAWTLSLIHI